MIQEYSDPSRADDTYSLPDVEIWEDEIVYVDMEHNTDVPYPQCQTDEMEIGQKEDEGKILKIRPTGKMSWWYWFCFPGCLPDSSAFGPFDTYEEALSDARDNG